MIEIEISDTAQVTELVFAPCNLITGVLDLSVEVVDLTITAEAV